MIVRYVNRRSKTFYLHEGKTKKGKPKYYFSTKTEGKLVKDLPEGYEIYEHPAKAQVFLRKKQPKVIADIERNLTSKYLQNIYSSMRYVLDIKGKVITIFESDQDVDRLREIFGDRSHDDFTIESAITYSPVMRFALVDEKKRIFIAERYCFLGSIDDWIHIGAPDFLDNLLEKYSKHLGEESFFDLF
jgi:hypothetical protein